MIDYHYLVLSDMLEVELAQCADEGRDVEPYRAAQAVIAGLPRGETRERMAIALYEGLMRLPPEEALRRDEPSDWQDILATLADAPAACMQEWTDAALYDHALGAWQARAAGCLLGKPFEGQMAAEIAAYYGTPPGQYAPLSYFQARANETNPALQRGAFLSIDRLDAMPCDDDTNYTVLALTLLEQYGKSFTRLAWADHFVRNLPPDATYTAERVAYRNLLDLRLPPASATYRNPYRDWIGAQIRADLYGYVSPGDPLSAAHMAWTDASVTHTRNGIYGAMWVAATLAETYTYPPAQAVRRALCVLPPRARLTCALRDAMADFDQGMTYEQAAAKLRVTWEESNQHHWCHVISNAVIVLNALLYGENDLGKTLSMAVLPGFDTDCNGATAGSILGLWLGSARLPSAWKDPMRGALQVSLAGMDNPSFTALAQRTVKCVRLSPTRENE